ncbi:MAG: Glu-tRNA(Gln) amidotransferase GatDE subunit E, partial [Candidatus Nitrosotenuis sp.]|nr:Glu-tRNA(Gln) amidotransferase GatDE subunit E [Candidatus Nitrosotenuis sp.]
VGIEKITKDDNVFDLSEFFATSKSKIIQKSLKEGASIKAFRTRGLAGMFGFEPYEGVRLGRELGQQVRFFGIGGIFHSDELPNYGIESADVEKIREKLELGKDDGFLIIAGTNEKIDFAIDAIINRIKDAKNGVPAETRAATPTGETVFLRPRPGSSRMYPETDIPPVITNNEELEFARANTPSSWDETIAMLQKKYELNAQLAEQIFDSDYLDLFESICADKKNNPNFVASVLCSTITNLERRGLDASLLKPEQIVESFQMLSEQKIAKESLEIIYEYIMSGKIKTVQEYIQKYLHDVNDSELEEFIGKIVSENANAIKSQGERASGMLMGMAMKSLRGKVSGEKINKILTIKIREIIDS